MTRPAFKRFRQAVKKGISQKVHFILDNFRPQGICFHIAQHVSYERGQKINSDMRYFFKIPPQFAREYWLGKPIEKNISLRLVAWELFCNWAIKNKRYLNY